MIASRLRSEARSGSSPSSSRSNHQHGSFYGTKLQHSNPNDAELKRALQRSYTSQTVRKWEKRWVTIHETSMRVHKWMPSGATKAPPIEATPPSTQLLSQDDN